MQYQLQERLAEVEGELSRLKEENSQLAAQLQIAEEALSVGERTRVEVSRVTVCAYAESRVGGARQ